jgi:excinuclease UvrABC ATPase subunit
MNIDRRTLRVTHPAYVELRTAIHEHLRKVFSKARREIYQASSSQRKSQRASESVKAIVEFAEKSVAPIAPTAARNLAGAWKRSADTPRAQKSLVKKYTVVELYRIVIEVATEIMTPSQLSKFLKRLTERLSR